MSRLAIGIAAALVLSVTLGPVPAHASPHWSPLQLMRDSICGPWTVVKGPRPSHNDFLYAVNADTPSDVWVVGSLEEPGVAGPFRTLAERWDGSAWHVILPQNTGTGDNDLYGVTVVSSNDVWAVGRSNKTQSSTPRPLIEMWNGARWRIVPSPILGQQSWLGSIRAFSADDIWASGVYADFSGNYRTLIEHWNGHVWSVVPSPNPGATFDSVGEFAASAPNDIWAFGSQSNDNENTTQTLIEHWDGHAWSVVPSPSPGSLYNGLADGTFVSGSDVWAVGGITGSDFIQRTLVEHWNGSVWSAVPSPNNGAGGNALYSVVARGPSDIWAAGSYFAEPEIRRTLVEHWSGSRWQLDFSPNPGGQYDGFTAITATSKGLWAVGGYDEHGDGLTLTESHC